MSIIQAKPIVEGKLWLVEQDGQSVGTLHKRNNNFVLSSRSYEIMFKKEELTEEFGTNFFVSYKKSKITTTRTKEVCGYPTTFVPHNSMYNVIKKLPLFTKSTQSKSLYCAGYYIIKFANGWSKSFCPKAITIEKYPYQGPFKTKEEMKVALKNAKSN